MTVKAIAFNKTGYDPFIDFIKAYAIIFVIVAHNLPTYLWDYCLFRVWADMQVPMFILIQAFHAYKKGTAPKIKWCQLLKRIAIPFFFIQGLIVLLKLLGGGNFHDIIKLFVISGGFGPGSYYFWIYIQVAFVLVLIWPLVKKLTRSQLIWLFLIFSVGCEVLLSLIHFPDAVYRLLAVRYLFLIPLVFIWIEDGVVLNLKNVTLSVISVVAVLFFCFTNIDLEPFFYNTGWSTHRWICYYYLPILLTCALWIVFKWTCNIKRLSSVLHEIAKSSYEIYLIQMLVFVLFPISKLNFISHTYIRLPLWMILTFVMGIIGGILMNKAMQKLLVVKR